jgi:hypothetical protein
MSVIDGIAEVERGNTSAHARVARRSAWGNLHVHKSASS